MIQWEEGELGETRGGALQVGVPEHRAHTFLRFRDLQPRKNREVGREGDRKGGCGSPNWREGERAEEEVG